MTCYDHAFGNCNELKTVQVPQNYEGDDFCEIEIKRIEEEESGMNRILMLLLYVVIAAVVLIILIVCVALVVKFVLKKKGGKKSPKEVEMYKYHQITMTDEIIQDDEEIQDV